MALQDPNDPSGYFDPAIADAMAGQDPFSFDWPPPQWADQQIGGAMGVVENAAMPALAAPEVAPMPGGGSASLIENAATPAIAGMEDDGSLPSPVAAELGEPSYQLSPNQPQIPLFHEGDALVDPVAPPLPFTPDPSIEGIKPQKSPEQRMIEYLQNPETITLDEQSAQSNAENYERDWTAVARNRNEQRADENHRLMVDAHKKAAADTEAIKADAIRLANTKVDGGRWYRDRTTSGKIGSWVAAIVGGLVSGRTGGPNTGLQNILKMIDDDVDAQKFDIQNQQQALGTRRGLVNDEYARSGDMFRAAESYRLASYDREISNVKDRAQGLDPRGKQYREAAKIILGLESAKQNAIIAMAERNQKFRIGDAELQGKQLENEAKRRKLAGIGMGGAGTPKITPEQWKARGFSNVPPEPMTPAEFKGWQEGQKRDADVTQARGAPDDKVRALNVAGLKQKDGSDFLARDVDVAKDLTKKFNTAKQVVSIIDEIDSIRERSGGESSWGNSADYQRLVVLGEELLKLQKQGTQGMSSDEDMNVLRKATGAKDVTTFRSISAGLKAARDRTESSIKSEFKDNRYDNWDTLRFPNVWAGKHVPTDGETKIKQRAYADDVIEQSDGKRPKRDLKTGEIQFE